VSKRLDYIHSQMEIDADFLLEIFEKILLKIFHPLTNSFRAAATFVRFGKLSAFSSVRDVVIISRAQYIFEKLLKEDFGESFS